jgi:hypothetical protein
MLLCLPVLSSHWLPVPSLVPDDLTNETLSIFSSRCTLISSTTYPNITPREDPIRLEHHSPWLLPGVYTHPVCMIVIFLIILLCCEVYLMHQVLYNVFPDVLSVWDEAFTEMGHDTTKNVIGVHFAATQPYLLALRSTNQVNSNLTHVVTLVIHFYTIISKQLLCQFVQSTTAFCMSNPSPTILDKWHSCHIFPHLVSSNHKSTQTCLYHFFRLNQMFESKSKIPIGQRIRKLGMPLL